MVVSEHCLLMVSEQTLPPHGVYWGKVLGQSGGILKPMFEKASFTHLPNNKTHCQTANSADCYIHTQVASHTTLLHSLPSCTSHIASMWAGTEEVLGESPPSPTIVGRDLSTSAERVSGEVLNSGAHCWKACCTAC